MREAFRIVGLVAIWSFAAMIWLIFGGVMSQRSSGQSNAMFGEVSELWGAPHEQVAPSFTLHWSREVTQKQVQTNLDGEPLRDALGQVLTVLQTTMEPEHRPVPIVKTAITADIQSDQRRKGLLWFSLYDVDFAGEWTAAVPADQGGQLIVRFPFPAYDGLYDAFQFQVDGQDWTDRVVGGSDQVVATIDVKEGQTLVIAASYRSRGLDSWTYRPATGTDAVRDLTLKVHTDFDDVDFPARTMSPSSKARNDAGWSLVWEFERLLTSRGMGVELPQRVQPGPLAASMSYSAPLSLGLFMGWIYVIGLLRKLDIHPMNHFFLAAAFFSFHLLFGYSADHLPVEAAFALSAVVSVTLVVSYLRLVVGATFAWREAGFAQMLYLVGFMGAHFVDGFTGLTLTVLGIGTLFAVMQLTGRLRWSEVFQPGAPARREPATVSPPSV